MRFPYVAARLLATACLLPFPSASVPAQAPAGVVDEDPWPSFRGPGGAGYSDGQNLPAEWSLQDGDNVAWSTPLPGLAHSSPIVHDGVAYLTTAISEGQVPGVVTGDSDAAGIDVADDRARHGWYLLAVSLADGRILWRSLAREGEPRVGRHVKASHSSQTPATDGATVVALMGSEGLFAFDRQGELRWSVDLGLMDPGLWGEAEYQWGPASSPVIWNGLVFVQNDRQADSFLAAYDLTTGDEVWRAARDEKPAWSTPVVSEASGRPELVTNGANWLRAYDPATGEELWRLPHGDLEVITPSPVVAGDTVVITGGYPAGAQPVYAIRTGALDGVDASAGRLRWTVERGSPYTSTPLIYRGIVYVVTDNGILSAYDLDSGERLYRTRLAVGAGFSASPVASDGRVYFASEDGEVLVVRAGREYELLARNEMGEVLMATPAIADGLLLVRGVATLHAIGAPPDDRSRSAVVRWLS